MGFLMGPDDSDLSQDDSRPSGDESTPQPRSSSSAPESDPQSENPNSSAGNDHLSEPLDDGASQSIEEMLLEFDDEGRTGRAGEDAGEEGARQEDDASRALHHSGGQEAWS